MLKLVHRSFSCALVLAMTAFGCNVLLGFESDYRLPDDAGAGADGDTPGGDASSGVLDGDVDGSAADGPAIDGGDGDAPGTCAHAFCASFDTVVSPEEGWDGGVRSEGASVTLSLSTTSASPPYSLLSHAVDAQAPASRRLVHSLPAGGKRRIIVSWDMRFAVTDALNAAEQIPMRVLFNDDVNSMMYLRRAYDEAFAVYRWWLVTSQGLPGNNLVPGPDGTRWTHFVLDATFASISSGGGFTLTTQESPSAPVLASLTIDSDTTSQSTPSNFVIEFGVSLAGDGGPIQDVQFWYDNVTVEIP